MPPSAFKRRAWEKYPIYYTDEELDNLDDDPHEQRNTSRTLAEELAAYEKKESAANHARQKTNTPVDPGKRVKARIGTRFQPKTHAATTATTVGSQSQEDSKTMGLGNPIGRTRQTPAVTNGKLQEFPALGTARSQLGKSVSPRRK